MVDGSNGLIGRQLGKYTLTEHIGSGGMATVYKGYRADLDRTVAVKILKVNPTVMDESLVSRFKLEARTIARLEHPHILSLYDYGVEDDLLYLVMPYLPGGSLSTWLKANETPSLSRVAEVLRQVATALDYAHREGIIHRDIKPDNILMDRNGNALVADFGIAKIAESESRLTATGGVVGTPAYLPPEQGTGADITPSSDIYSLGVVIYEIITGVKPYTAETPIQVILQHMNEPIPNVLESAPYLPASLESVMERALAKQPAERYQTATDFTDDFTRAIETAPDVNATMPLSGTGSTLSPPTSTQVGVKTADVPLAPDAEISGSGNTRQDIPSQKPPVWLYTAIIGLLVAGGIGIAFFVAGQDETLPNSQATEQGAPSEAIPTIQAVAPVVQDTFGRAVFTTTDSFADTLELEVENLRPPGAGNVYAVWLQNTTEEDFLPVGELSLDTFGSGSLAPYVDGEGQVLLANYNAVAISQEQEVGEAPAGEIVYGGELASPITGTFEALFVTSADGINGQGLAASARAEAAEAETHSGLAQSAGTLGSMKSHAEHTVNIIEGTQVDYNNNGRPENPGAGVGVIPLLESIEQQILDLATDPTASTTLQSNIEFLRVCVVNAQTNSERIVELEQEMLAANSIEEVAEQAETSTVLAEAVLEGRDANGNGQIDPFENECALEQMEEFSLLLGTINIVEAETSG